MTESYKESILLGKIKSYIGFAKKSRNIKIGIDNILAYKKFSVIIFSRDISENSKNKLKNYAEKLNVVAIEVDSLLTEYVFDTDRIKAFSITNENLAKSCVECIKKLEDSTVE